MLFLQSKPVKIYQVKKILKISIGKVPEKLIDF